MNSSLLSQLILTLFGLVGAWIVGNALAARWQLLRKRKELELDAAQNFYESYGEFFAIWKLWNQVLEDLKGGQNDILEDRRKELLIRAAAMEGRIEATLLKVASEIVLTKDDQENLGQLRQAFGVVRYCIRHRRELPYFASNIGLYVDLKRLSTEFGVLLSRPLGKIRASIFANVRVPTAAAAFAAWREITSNRHESNWKGFLRENW